MKPDFAAFRKLSAKHSLIPTFIEMPADLDTPLTVYLKLAQKERYASLLESVEGGEKI